MIEIMLNQLVDFLAECSSVKRTIESGHMLFAAGDAVRAMYLVLSGEVQLLRRDSNGRELLLQRATNGTVLAESSLYAHNYHCHSRAHIDSELLVIDKQSFLSALTGHESTTTLWAQHLANEVRVAREQAAILNLRTVAERLDAWLAGHSGQLPERGQWQALATEIGVSSEALYRELAKRH